MLHVQRDHVKKQIKASFKRRSSSVSGLLVSASHTIEQKKDEIIKMMLFFFCKFTGLVVVTKCEGLSPSSGQSENDISVSTFVFSISCFPSLTFKWPVANCNVHNSYSHLKLKSGRG